MVGSFSRHKYTQIVSFKCPSAVASSYIFGLGWVGLCVLAQLSLSCQAEDSSLKFGVRNREEKVALKRMEYVLSAAFIHQRGDPDLPVL